MHAERPNELIHWDYLHMGESESGEVYILVIKDDASKFVWLLPCVAADADTTFVCLLDWFATFGVCRTWVSDQGTHFMNTTIAALQHALGAHHHFTTARCPWANGTVEVVMRETLRCCRALLSEWMLQPRYWPRVVKIVQMVLNNTPSQALGGVAPITAMMGLAAMGPSDSIAVPGALDSVTLESIQATQRQNVVKLQTALEDLHRRVSKANKATRAAGRSTMNNKKGAAMAQFDIGDYVLYADVWQHTRSKLRVKWCGPAQVTATVSNWIFEIENLITGQRREAHASRLKFYADASMDVSEHLLRHVAHNSEGHVVAELLNARYNPTLKQHEIELRWRGLSEAEDSLEPAITLLQDVPTVARAFVKKYSQRSAVRALRKAVRLD
ncbi:unnamed protein product [Phytophthora fragariaefolia]|uniref:Unnamed protein product n=1 Tax=Phytophthora fragariaefolia TaxID=1490495 RepID=A0A9W7D0J0_9STRA|nr:unnamed protein product [Phytophthora fragariaefolia]